MKELYEIQDKELLEHIIKGDTYDLEAMIEYYKRNSMNYEYLNIDEMYEEICMKEGM